MQRPLKELVCSDPAMPSIAQWVGEANRAVELLPPADPDATLLALQVTTASTLGALAYETGGILIDHGWLRVLGAGSSRLERDLCSWNGLGSDAMRLPGALLVADDAVGGFFAISGGGIDAPAGNVCYFAPDTCAWEDLELGLTDWLRWAMCGELEAFYELARWPGWELEVGSLGCDRGLLIYPPVWTEGPELQKRSRKPVPIEELWSLHTIEFSALLNGDM